MKLCTVEVKEFKSVWDSTPFEIDRVACLVGKNEAGKTSILQALYRLNPIVSTDSVFDVTDDYPRAEVENYQQDVESGRRNHATVIRATFVLENAELDAVAAQYGSAALRKQEIVLSRGYDKSKPESKLAALCVDVPVDEQAIVKHLISTYEIPEPTKSKVISSQSLAQLVRQLGDVGQQQEQAAVAARAEASKVIDEAEKASALEACKSLAESEPAKALRVKANELAQHKNLGIHIWSSLLQKSFPKFLYFDEYYQMRGYDNVQALKERKVNKQLKKSDHPLLGLIDLARLDLDKLMNPTRTQDLKNKLQGASNYLSSQILKYWSQNKHLRMNFDVRPGLSGDPDGMQSGTNIWGEVFDAKHLVSTSLGTRSAGFVWFFSFLAWYSAVKKQDEPLVLLLDEPGLSLHGKAQEDLLKFFETEIVSNPKHQLIYTTHSPFMVDPLRFDRVRIVQDKGIDSDDVLTRDQDGTKVFTDVLAAGTDSLFPLQGALGYEIYQTLFIGPNCLIVEGVSDLLYIQTISGILQGLGRIGLDDRWTITPVGGSARVPTFVALIGAQKNLKVATLIDFQKDDKQTIENLYKKKLLKKSHVLTFADFVGKAEADIEDMFDEEFYLQLVREEYASALSDKQSLTPLTGRSPRVLVRLNEYFTNFPLNDGTFSHYRPARYFAQNLGRLTVPKTTLDRFENAFVAVNALLI